MEKRRDLRELRVRSLECLSDACLRSGEIAAAVRHAEEVIELEPFRESGYRLLMRAHVAGGNPAQALLVYERCRRFLADELGAYPSYETEAVYRDILKLKPAPDRNASHASARPPATKPATAPATPRSPR